MDKKEKKSKPLAKFELPKIDKNIKEPMFGFFIEFFSLGGLLCLIMLVIFLEVLKAFGLIEINIPFL